MAFKDGSKGTLVIRTFDEPRVSVTGEMYDAEVSVRGRGVLVLDAERRNQR